MMLIIMLVYLFNQNTNSQYVYPCSVSNCFFCTYTNFCGICQENYILQIPLNTMIPICTKVACETGYGSCEYCVYTNQCQMCGENYLVTPEGGCYQSSSINSCPDNCYSCNLQNEGMNTFCMRCIFGYVPLVNGSCVPTYSKIPQNCVSALYPQICQICAVNYAVTPNFGCTQLYNATCDIEYCSYCNSNGTCQVCQNGYELSLNVSANDCVPTPCQSSIPNCAVCSNSTFCLQCQFGYTPNANSSQCLYQSFACTIANCVVCGFGPNQCSICQNGYFQQKNSTTQFVECVAASQLSASNTLPSNCAEYGPLNLLIELKQTAASVLCVKCNPNFSLIGGNCVLLTNQNQYSCEVPNCRHCIFNNYCGLCSDGYRVLPSSGGLCVRLYSPAPNCLLNSKEFTFDSPCLLCQSGFLNYQGNCYAYNTSTACNVSGCNYCVSNNSCAVCSEGYASETSFGTNLTFCTPICQIANCFLCATSLTCSVCNYGYVLNAVADLCTKPSPPSDCTTVFGLYCLSCNANQCTNCQTGFSVVIGKCCQNAIQNIYGCMAYPNQCSSECIQCFPGFVLTTFQTDSVSLKSQCIGFACSIPNCQYCFRSKNCIVCSVGYVLNSSSGQCSNNSQNVNCSTVANPFCTKCSTANSNMVCHECADGYTLMNNQCYCSIPNCLKCMGSAFCLACASPFVSSPTSGQCVPPPNFMSVCQVQHCSECNGPSKCSICAAGFSLTPNNQCVKNSCPSSMNCLLCDASQLTCYECAYGFTHNQLLGSHCVSVPSQYNCNVTECALCSFSNPNVCVQCAQSFEVDSATGKCVRIRCIANCQLCVSASTCVQCNIGFYLNSSYICQPNEGSQPIQENCFISNCLICLYNASGNTCLECLSGYQLNQLQNECIPQQCGPLFNCEICVNIKPNQYPLCIQCQQGYYLNSYLQCVPYSPSLAFSCNIYQCFDCAYNNSCALCASGYFILNGICVSANNCASSNCILCTSPNLCYECQQGYTLNSSTSACVYNCNLPNCNVCLNATYCSNCSMNFTWSASESSCVCSQNFVYTNGYCLCPNSGFTYALGQCISCNITCCVGCAQTNICVACPSSFILTANQCFCFQNGIIVNSTCICPANYTLGDGVCTLCQIQYCSICRQSNICNNCVSNFTLINSTTCECQPPQTIQIINNASVCKCPPNTTFSKNQCVPCSISNCNMCQSPNNCSTCALGYKPNSPSAQFCNLCVVVNCQYCLYNSYCTQCESKQGKQLVPNANGQICIECSIPNCKVCSVNNTCYRCMPGFIIGFSPKQGKLNVCVNCSGIIGCLYCSDDQVCTACYQGFVAVSGKCLPCIYPCSTCIAGSPNACEICQFPFALYADDTGKCYTCLDPNCLVCQSVDTSICHFCAPGFQIISNLSSCSSLCIPYCNRCSPSGICMSCMAGYMLYNGQCILCNQAPVCQSCLLSNLSACLYCGYGYFLSNDLTCLPCPSNCEYCESQTSCMKYKFSTKQFQITINSTSYTTICDPGCIECMTNVPSLCISCFSGHFLQQTNKSCLPCQSNCKACSQSNSSNCLSCYDNSYLSNGQCLQCAPSSNCLLCSNSNLTQCIVCPFGFSLMSSGVCETLCPPNCLSCTNSTFCSLCQNGYSRSSAGQCLPCLSTCKYCPQDRNDLCLDCGPGFYYSRTQGCVRCSPHCIQCTNLRCIVCQVGYMLSPQLTCTAICHIPCATCSPLNTSKCQSCLAGYQLNANTATCEPSPNCSTTCVLCPFGYSLTPNGPCLQCLVSHCARCSSNNAMACSNCYPGFYLNPSLQCAPCPIGCSTCSSATRCFTCSSGFTSQIQPIITEDVICKPCVFPCASCYKNVYICQSCVDGYTFQGWKCVSSFNFGFSLSLNANLTYFQTQYGQLLAQIANCLSSNNTNIVTVNSINQVQTTYAVGSDNTINISGNLTILTSPNSPTSTRSYYQLLYFMSPNSYIANMPVQSSVIQVNGGSINQQGPSLPWVLGIFIPLFIILLIILGLLGHAYFKGNHKNNKIRQQKLNVREDLSSARQKSFIQRGDSEIREKEYQRENTRL